MTNQVKRANRRGGPLNTEPELTADLAYAVRPTLRSAGMTRYLGPSPDAPDATTQCAFGRVGQLSMGAIVGLYGRWCQAARDRCGLGEHPEAADRDVHQARNRGHLP
jgi:hypothetical protein